MTKGDSEWTRKVSEAPELAKNAPYVCCGTPHEVDLVSIVKQGKHINVGSCDACEKPIVWSDTVPEGPKKICTSCTIRAMGIEAVVKMAKDGMGRDKITEIVDEVFKMADDIDEKEKNRSFS